MSESAPGTLDPADALLLARVRAGDSAAFEELYREHVDGARSLARILVGADRADELTAESFARVLSALKDGKGPTDNFRAYLHVTIRNGYRDGLRGTQEQPASDQPWIFDDAEAPVEEMAEGLDDTVATDALGTLPEKWQRILWHLEVEGRKPAEVATILGMQANAVTSLAYRAREGLKRAYLDLHAGPVPSAQACQWAHARMSQGARGDLGAKAQAKLDDHVAGCAECAAAFATVEQVNAKLGAYVLPVILLAAVTGSGKGFLWLVGGAAGGGAAAGSSGGNPGPLASNSGVIAAASVAAVGIVAGGVWGVSAVSGDDPAGLDSTSSEAGPGEAGDDPPADSEPDVRPDPAPDPPPADGPDDDPDDEPAVAPLDAPDDDEDPAEEPPPEDTAPPAPDPDDRPEFNDPQQVPDVVVRTERPVEVRITECETYGDLTLPTTRGVRYELVKGDGEQGPWKVRAFARDGFTIAPRSATEWSGDLGAWELCPVELTAASVHRSFPVLGTWVLSADVTAFGSEPKDLELTFNLDGDVTSLAAGSPIAATGDGWSCTVTGPRTVVCAFAYDGTAPPQLTVTGDVLASVFGISGTASLRVDGADAGVLTIQAGLLLRQGHREALRAETTETSPEPAPEVQPEEPPAPDVPEDAPEVPDAEVPAEPDAPEPAPVPEPEVPESVAPAETPVKDPVEEEVPTAPPAEDDEEPLEAEPEPATAPVAG